jgi:hypothetical protein
LEELLKTDFKSELELENDRIYYCMGSWVEAGTGRFYSDETDDLNEDYPYGTILYSAVVTKSGKMVESAHSCSLIHIERWIKFLRNCGGFRIF